MKWATRFARDLIGSYGDGVRAMAALPWFFAAVIGWEFAQHAMEVHIGFFDSHDAASAVATGASRMVIGWIKEISVYLGGFLVIRRLVAGRGERAVGPVLPALLRYLPYMAYSLLLAVIAVYADSIVPDAAVSNFRLTIGLLQVAVEPALMLWVVSAATDGVVTGPLASARRTGLFYLYALPLFFIARWPLSFAHQMLNFDAIGQPPAILWPMLAADAVTVGLIIAFIPAISVRVARRIRAPRHAQPNALQATETEWAIP